MAFRRVLFVSVDELRLPADLLQVAEGLLLDGGEAAGDVALGRLAVGEVAGLVRLDDLVHVGLPGGEELLGHLRRRRARRADLLGAGQLGGLPEAGGAIASASCRETVGQYMVI